MALSLAMIWGKAGILSFGQTAFFGIGGYLYGIYTLNVLGSGATWIGILVGVLAGGIVAAILGYFMFYGGVNDVFVGLTTLALTLVLQTFMAQTAGPEWTVGEARLERLQRDVCPADQHRGHAALRQAAVLPLPRHPDRGLPALALVGRLLAGDTACSPCRRTGRGRRRSGTTSVSCRCRSSVSPGASPR